MHIVLIVGRLQSQHLEIEQKTMMPESNDQCISCQAVPRHSYSTSHCNKNFGKNILKRHSVCQTLKKQLYWIPLFLFVKKRNFKSVNSSVNCIDHYICQML